MRVAIVTLAIILSTMARADDDALASSDRAYQAGRYAEAARSAQQAVDQSETPAALLALARARQALGEYRDARSLADKALTLSENTGPDSADTASALYRQGEIERAAGNYAGALAPAQRALTIREKTAGAKHPDTAASLHSVGEIYRSKGEYAKAKPAAERALRIREQALGNEHPDTAESLDAVGLTYYDTGDQSKARSFVQRGLTVREQVLGAEHPLTAESINNLAVLDWKDKDYKKALAGFESALAIKEKTLGAGHPATGAALNNLAEIYRAMGDTAKAQSLLQRAAATWEKALGADDPRTASALSNLGTLYWTAGRYAEAKPLLERAAASWEKSLGADHPDTGRSLNLLAAFNLSSGDYKQALALYQRGLAAEQRTLANVYAVSSEDQKLEFLERTQGHYFAALSLIEQHFADDPTAVRFGLELVLRHKGVVLDAQTRTREALAGHLKGEALRTWQRLSQNRAELAKLLMSGSLDQTVEEYRQAVDTLQNQVTTDEQYLSEHSGIVAQEIADQTVTAELVARRLPPDSVLAEFVWLRDWDAKRLTWLSTSHYIAFILTPDARVQLVDLGPGDAIDASVSAVSAAITDPHFLEQVTTHSHDADGKLAALYDKVVRPIDKVTVARGRLIVSPDGQLHQVPFGALRTAEGEYLVEKRMISYVASGRDLLRNKSGVDPKIDLVLAANPAFDDRGTLKAGKTRSRGALRSADYPHVEYPPLPGTAEEAQAIPPLLHGTKKILVGKEANESAVRALQSPRVLHLATHGFFLKDSPHSDQLPDPLGRGGRGVFRGGAAGPMVRSGLALAGANHAEEIAQGDDGILTALEVSDMDLYGTDLVVLSACETALGEIKTGEGVYGLRRAFVLAGAHSLVMSLWPVSDKITRDQMERFYQVYGDSGDSAAALAAAQRDTIKQLREATSKSSAGEALAPVNLWAPFIVQQSGALATTH